MMERMKVFGSLVCIILVLGTMSACAHLNDSDLTRKNTSEKATFLEEKQELLKLSGVTEDQDGNVLIPLKINEEIKIALPNGSIVLYRLNTEDSKIRDDNCSISVCKEYKYKFADSFATARLMIKTDCNWTDNNVTISKSDHSVSGRNPFGDIIISNKKNTILKPGGDSVVAEASGNIDFIFKSENKSSSELIAYRLQIIADKSTSQSAVIKVIR